MINVSNYVNNIAKDALYVFRSYASHQSEQVPGPNTSKWVSSESDWDLCPKLEI